MAKPFIRLSLYNQNGCCAELCDSEGNDVEIVVMRNKADAKAICVEAARRLRKLADDFDLLSSQEDAFKTRTQNRIRRIGVK